MDDLKFYFKVLMLLIGVALIIVGIVNWGSADFNFPVPMGTDKGVDRVTVPAVMTIFIGIVFVIYSVCELNISKKDK